MTTASSVPVFGRMLADTDDLTLLAAASTGDELLAAVRAHRPALVLLDVRLADISGLDLVGPVTRLSPSTGVVMLSMFGANAYIDKARSLGARGYLTKDCLEHELIGALRHVVNGSDFVSPRPRLGHRLERVDALDSLTARELEVLELLAAGLTNTEIGERLVVSPRTVESHRAAVQRKLGVRTRAELARFARDAGLLA
jgi:DNA-binding NarL/FixJ family response regulator